MNKEFNENGYIIYKNIIPKDYLVKAQDITLYARNKIINQNLKGKQKEYGGKIYWDGLEMASTEYTELFEMYTSDFMYEIAKELLNTEEIYLFNDQIVTKLPYDGFIFEPHSDNGLGPNPKLATKGYYKSITCCWVLDDFTNNNGPIVMFNKQLQTYETILPKVGDIAVWDGETIHYSGENKSNLPRRVLLQIYTTKDITKIESNSDFSSYYGQRFIKGKTINQFKNKTNKTIL
jgi:ectoine hydroxylase-related dioxygenase (phytanoyl-CoA dioxygenase family)